MSASQWHRAHQMPDDLRVRIRRTGTASHPWEVRCTGCQTYRVHIVRSGAAAVNTRGVGNATWERARDVGLRHLDWHAGVTR